MDLVVFGQIVREKRNAIGLKQEELRKICDIMVRDVAERIKSKQIFLSFFASALLASW